ncbi:MAG TPA: hypothetical protein VKW04_09640 [Planctomycetota bacterium]|nr:hypothetical protein [Planctomycetota bacterium]
MADPRNDVELWMWDGASEYEGIFTRLDGEAFSARVRQARRAGASLGKRLAPSSLDLHRVFTQRRFLAHFTGSMDGTLLEAQIEGVQACSEGPFEFLLSGRFAKLDDKQLALLRKMSVENAALMLQRQVS